uniref:HRAS-like suppressor 2 n=1 Tax=Sinocyclocheilus rhinocerous TaxID=307959 RepID=A0A673HG02_9TELE
MPSQDNLIEFSYPIGYAHWGVYDGDGYVIHFAVAGKHENFHLKTKIRRQLLSEVNVPKGARVSVSNNQHALEPSPVDEIRKRLDALLDKEFTYKIFTHNCEHFATFVRSGKAIFLGYSDMMLIPFKHRTFP